jgi:cbb3-type cytochrome oxidase subunit 3
MEFAFALVLALCVLPVLWWLLQRQTRQQRNAKPAPRSCLSMRDTLERRVRDGDLRF